jgi:hypothetical protein
MFQKYVQSLVKKKPMIKTPECVEYVLQQSDILQLTLMNPPYQTDLNIQKVNDMIESYHNHPEYGRFKNILVVAARMVGTPTLYLVDGQHRVEMLNRIHVTYPFRVIFYPIYTDDQMRKLFKELNLDSHKNMAYVSLGADTAKLVNDFITHYEHTYFTKKRSASKLYSIRAFVDEISDYIKTFDTLSDVIQDMEQKQKDFISNCEFTKYYAEEADCITNHFILPIKSCNFIQYLKDPTIEPTYEGKNNAIPKTISLILKARVWNQHVGREHGTSICMVCKYKVIDQISFHCGHVIASSKGGQNTVENLRPICQSCNSSMGDTNLFEFINRVS